MSAFSSISLLDFSSCRDVVAPKDSLCACDAELPGAALHDLGLDCAAGRSAPVDLVAAHRWFNLAALHGHPKAARFRLEIAAELSRSEIETAQRSARDWLAAEARGRDPVTAGRLPSRADSVEA